MPALLPKVAALCTSHPRRVIAVAILVTLPVLMVAAGLEVSTSRTALVSEDNPHWQRYMAFAHEFGIPEDLVVVAKGEPAQVHAFSDAVAAELSGSPQVKAVFHRVDLSVFEERAPLFIEASVLSVLERLAKDPAVGRLRAHSDPASRLQALAELMEAVPKVVSDDRAEAETALMATALEALLAGLGRYTLEGKRDPIVLLDREATMQTALGDKRESALDAKGYLTTDAGQTGVIFVRPTYTRDEMSVVVPFVALVRQACEAAGRAHPEVQFGLTGIPASEVDELTSITHDTVLTTVIALVGVVALFMLYFPALRLLAISLVPVLFGTIWTGAFIRLAFGFVNLMSSIFLVVLIGLGIDFSIHIASRFLEQRRAGDASDVAAFTAVSCAGRAVLTGAVTTAGAFLAVGWCGFKGIEELGIAASVGMMITVASALTVFPAILALMGSRLPAVEGRTGPTRLIVHRVVQARLPILVVALVLTVPLGVLAYRTPFDFSLLNLLPEDVESAQLMVEMIENRDLSANAVAVAVDDLDEARDMEARLKALPTVYRVVSAASFLPPEQDLRMQALARIQLALREGHEAAAAEGRPAPTLLQAVTALESALERLSELAFAAGNQKEAVEHLERSLDAVSKVREVLEDGGATPSIEAGARAYGERLAGVVDTLSSRVDLVLAAGPLTPEVLPANLRQRFVSAEGRFAVYAVPRYSMWDRDALAEFIAEVRGVAPGVTGFPETFYENAGLIQRGFYAASLYASIAVVVLLWIDLRRLRYVLYALIPVGLGAVWMLGCMGLLGLPYNLANIVGLPLIIGVGIDSGVHVLHRYLETGSVETATVKTGGAVMLSSLTTMVGFGSLAFASHRGYSSLGQILFLGVGACLMMAVTVLPAVLAMVDRPAQD
jgi:hopanoid biosynthesis associated RND transporter like protein HpnN